MRGWKEIVGSRHKSRPNESALSFGARAGQRLGIGLNAPHTPHESHSRVPAVRRLAGSSLLLALCAAVLAMVSCSSTPRPRLGAISVTDPTGTIAGQVSSVIVTAQVAVSISVGSDQSKLGVDWTVDCLGSSVVSYTTDVCGTLNPVHVGSNNNMLYTAPLYVPIGNTVTLTATVTSDPSQKSSVTLTILPLPITIAITGTPPTQLGASETTQIIATVTNDSLAKGVNWKVACGGSDCGTLNPTLTASAFPTVYTAPAKIPAGGTVKITATSVADSTKSVEVDIQLLPISIAVAPQTVTIPALGSGNLTATVAWDASDAGVDWDAPVCSSAGDCGSIAPTHTASGVATVYTAPKTVPAGKKVTVTAHATSDPKVTAKITITIAAPPPIRVTVRPATNLLQLGGTTTAVATVFNDYNNAGVTWDCSPTISPGGNCFPNISPTAPFQTTYTAPSAAPANNLFTFSAVSVTDPTKIGTAIIHIAPRITVNITTAPPTATAGSPSVFSAAVTNDIAPGGVDWSASNCGALDCGTFDSGDSKAPNHSKSGASIKYTPPVQLPATNVTITATSTASETVTPVQSASATVNIIPVPYARFIPFAPSTLPVADPASPTLVKLVAVAANDTSNEGIDWSVCSTPATCGAFLITPEIPATLKTQAIPPVYGASLHTASGQTVSFLPPTEAPGSGNITIKVTATADKKATNSATIAISNQNSGFTGAALHGAVQVGTLAVSDASVQLFASGSTGYGSASTPLSINPGGADPTIVSTAADGTFSIPAGFICPAQTAELYLIAQGGTPAGGKPNAQLGLMTAVGPCSNLSSTAPLMVNEVTTVASMWALAPFFGQTYASIGSSSTNYTTGFANAFAAVNNLVDITTGLAPSTTPSGNGIVPQAEINTLADAIDSCAATAGGAAGDGSACGTFLTAANITPACGGVLCPPPTGILQAVQEVAQYPGNIYATPTPGTPLYNIAAAMTTQPFLPVLTEAPNDWSIAISFSGGGLGGSGAASPQSTAMAIDGAGNVWVSNRRTASVSEFSNLGAALSPFATGTTSDTAGGFTGGGLLFPKRVAIDLLGDAWILNQDSSLTELDFNGKPVKGTPFSGGGTATANGLAIDGSGDVWVADAGPPGDVAKYAGFNSPLIGGNQPKNGSVISPPGGYVHGIQNPNGAIAVDGAGTVWVLNEGNFSAAELNSNTGGLIQTDFGYIVDPNTGKLIMPLESIFNSLDFGTTMAIDSTGVDSQGKPNGTGNVFIPNPTLQGTNVGQIYKLLFGGNTATDGGIGQSLGVTIPPASAPIAMDGAGHLWQVTFASDIVNPLPAALAEMSSSGVSINGSLTSPGVVGPNLESGATSLAVDGSGNVWVLVNAINSTVTEFIGVAAPVVTPLSVGVQTKSLGKKP